MCYQTCRLCLDIQTWQAKLAIHLLHIIAVMSPQPHLVGTCKPPSRILLDMTMSAWRATGKPTVWRHRTGSRLASKYRIDRYINQHMLLVSMLLGNQQHSMMHMAAFELHNDDAGMQVLMLGKAHNSQACMISSSMTFLMVLSNLTSRYCWARYFSTALSCHVKHAHTTCKLLFLP